MIDFRGNKLTMTISYIKEFQKIKNDSTLRAEEFVNYMKENCDQSSEFFDCVSQPELLNDIENIFYEYEMYRKLK